MNNTWPGIKGPVKVNTVLQYDEDYEDVITWGAEAFYKPSRRDKDNNKQPKLVELFRLYLGDVPEEMELDIELPEGLTPTKVITDYLREMGNFCSFCSGVYIFLFRELIKKL